MDDLVEQITRGNVSGVKIVLATVVAVLSTYQVALMAVGYGKVRVPFLKPKPASFTHRALGDMILVITLFVAWMCITYFEITDGIEHAVDACDGIDVREHTTPSSVRREGSDVVVTVNVSVLPEQ